MWGGATNLYSDRGLKSLPEWLVSSEIIKSVTPKTNRILVFDGSIPHSVSHLSKVFTDARITLMFKLDMPFSNLVISRNN